MNSTRQEEEEIRKLDDNLWRADGGVSLETLEETLDISLPLELDEEYDTLGGMSCFRSLP